MVFPGEKTFHTTMTALYIPCRMNNILRSSAMMILSRRAAAVVVARTTYVRLLFACVRAGRRVLLVHRCSVRSTGGAPETSMQHAP